MTTPSPRDSNRPRLPLRSCSDNWATAFIVGTALAGIVLALRMGLGWG